MMQGLAAVPLPPDTVLLSAAHPVADAACFASAQEDGVWSLPAREVALERSSAHPLALVVPGLRLQLQCAGVPGSDRTAFSHLLSCSVPLGACFKDLLTRNMYTLQRSTCEDGMTYLVQLAVDTRRLSASDVQQTATEMQAGLDVLLHHQSAMAAALGTPLKTVDELVAEVCELKDQRARATASVLAALSAGEQSNSMLDLQYGRAFGMRVDQQQCRAARGRRTRQQLRADAAARQHRAGEPRRQDRARGRRVGCAGAESRAEIRAEACTGGAAVYAHCQRFGSIFLARTHRRPELRAHKRRCGSDAQLH